MKISTLVEILMEDYLKKGLDLEIVSRDSLEPFVAGGAYWPTVVQEIKHPLTGEILLLIDGVKP